MVENWLASFYVVAGTLLVACLAVLVHYEGLNILATGLARKKSRHARKKVLHGIFGVLILHTVEIWLFGIAFWLLLQLPDTGHLSPSGMNGFLDAVYFSAMNYTTVGDNEALPAGPIRFLESTEALIGFVLITWSATFTYFEMERYWKRDR